MISVIVRTYRRPHLLQRALLSLRAQTCKPSEVVVVQMCTEKLQLPPCITHLPIGRLLSRGEACNKGIEQAKSRFIVCLDDDDTVETTFIETMQAALERHPTWQAAACHSYRVEETEEGKEIKKSIYLTPARVSFAALLQNNQFPIHAFVFAKDLWSQVGGYDPTLAFFEDWAFHLACLQETNIGVVPKPLVNYHFQQGKIQGFGQRKDQELLKEAFIDEMVRRDLKQGKMGLGTLLLQEETKHKQASFVRMLRRDFYKGRSFLQRLLPFSKDEVKHV